MTAATRLPELGALELALGAALVLANAALSLALRLHLERRLLLAAGRAALQLALLVLVLRWLFRTDSAAVVLAVMVGMAVLAGFEAVRRTSHRIRGMLPLSMLVMLTSSFAVTFYGTQVVMRIDPWYEPRYLLPILGMVLGNTLNGISLGLETTLAGFVAERDRIDVLLAHGATRWRAAREPIRRALRTGMIPILNSMAATGVIAIPGMMTGQILAGQSPRRAAAYQIFILFCIAGGVSLGTVGAVLASARMLFDERDRLRIDRVQSREGATRSG